MNLFKSLFGKKLDGAALARSAKKEEFALIELLSHFKDGAPIHGPLTQQRWQRVIGEGYAEQLGKFGEAGWLKEIGPVDGVAAYGATEAALPFVAAYEERLAQDRAAQQEIDQVWEELKRRLRTDKHRGEFAALHTVPESTGDVPDEMEARLVILGPERSHTRKATDSKARLEVEQILQNRGRPEYSRTCWSSLPLIRLDWMTLTRLSGTTLPGIPYGKRGRP